MALLDLCESCRISECVSMNLRKALATSERWHWVNQESKEWDYMDTLCGKRLEFHMTSWLSKSFVRCYLCFPKDKDYPMCKSCEKATPERRLLFAVKS